MEEVMGTGGKTKMATGLEDSRVVNRAPISLGNFHMSSLLMLSINFYLLPKKEAILCPSSGSPK